MNGTDAAPLRLTWNNVAKTYGSRTVWRHLAGELSAGDVLVVSGPNGAGKSTLLRLFCGLEQPSAGTIEYEFGGRRLGPTAMRPLLGLVAPDVALYRELTALEHMRFFAATRGLDCSEAAMLDQLARVGLHGREHDRVAAYSSGMALRLKYAAALLHRPPVLLLDEPTAMFDEAGRALVAALIADQRARGITVLATNDERELAWGDFVLKAAGQGGKQ
ncbi:MAG TPA: ABC transporter ATP-binding protein [Herpetosiphonaceae bacterium]|nr:ABC transporter ATP-binding protein [Herpetosiphonaceae bacterium]